MSFLETLADTRKDIHEEFGLINQAETQTMKTLTQATRRDRRTQLEPVEARGAQTFREYSTAEAR